MANNPSGSESVTGAPMALDKSTSHTDEFARVNPPEPNRVNPSDLDKAEAANSQIQTQTQKQTHRHRHRLRSRIHHKLLRKNLLLRLFPIQRQTGTFTINPRTSENIFWLITALSRLVSNLSYMAAHTVIH
ncbi:UNVERIFIED_CONTAM: hypothetical protein Sradi_4094800 [Sesamum radiatum]|uniref:Uncharacterized protein n=1 Tax=Sesamum radiatum TaxID=300843 RepID=A0AAW2PJY7_SESRA